MDSGRYRASWFLNERTPTEKVAQEHDGHASEGTELPVPGAPTLKLGKYPVVFLTNGLPYAQRIEDGWSTQKAPDGVLKLTLAARGYL